MEPRSSELIICILDAQDGFVEPPKALIVAQVDRLNRKLLLNGLVGDVAP